MPTQTPKRSATHCNTLQYTDIFPLQHTTIHWYVFWQHTATFFCREQMPTQTPKRAATYCNTHTYFHCNALQHTDIFFLQHTVTFWSWADADADAEEGDAADADAEEGCNTLQNIATRWNISTATHCNTMTFLVVSRCRRRRWRGWRSWCRCRGGWQCRCWWVLCNTLQYTATHYCNALQRTAMQYNADAGKSCATHCNTLLQHTTATHCNKQQHTATHCNTLPHTATHYDTLQHAIREKWRVQQTATHRTRSNIQQHTVTHCKHCHTLQNAMREKQMLQHTAANSNAQQHTATQ